MLRHLPQPNQFISNIAPVASPAHHPTLHTRATHRIPIIPQSSRFNLEYNNNDLSSRQQGRRRLLDLCAGDWAAGGKILHYCGLACPCKDRDDAVDLIMHALMDSWLGFFPPIPALNRWNKVYAPTSWWMFGVLFYSIVGRAMASAKQDIVGGSEHEDLALHVDGLIGPASAGSVKLVKLARWKKTTEWLNCPFTFPRLSTHVCSMQTILSLMARAFEESRHRNTCSIIPWLLPAT